MRSYPPLHASNRRIYKPTLSAAPLISCRSLLFTRPKTVDWLIAQSLHDRIDVLIWMTLGGFQFRVVVSGPMGRVSLAQQVLVLLT